MGGCLGLAVLVVALCGCESGASPHKPEAPASAKSSANKSEPVAEDFVCVPPAEDKVALGFSENHLVGHADHLWDNGMTLNVHFLDGSDQKRAFVRKHVPEWSKYANLKFAFHDPESKPEEVHIAVTFEAKKCTVHKQLASSGEGCPAAYSFSGNTSPRAIEKYGHSVCLCTPLTAGTVIHELGHALSLKHEHMRSELVSKLDRDKVLAWCKRANLSERACEGNILRPLDTIIPAHKLVGTPYDKHSIMHYPISGSWTKDGKPVVGGDELSPLDKKGIAKLYPKTATPTADSPVALKSERTDEGWKLAITGEADKLGEVTKALYILHSSMTPDEAEGDAKEVGHPYLGLGDNGFTARALVSFKDGSAVLLKTLVMPR